jgi:hypothetical protein
MMKIMGFAVRKITRITMVASATRALKDIIYLIQAVATAVRRDIPIILMARAGTSPARVRLCRRIHITQVEADARDIIARTRTAEGHTKRAMPAVRDA